ncbi:MAG TPA: FG-GAP-like repeat-containing protein [Terriglobia bacterium]|nr:FG-GAP-like repeat-containing protein [Terriglobia bacterium]
MNSKNPIHLEFNRRGLCSRREFFLNGAGILAAGNVLRPIAFFPSPLQNPGVGPGSAASSNSASHADQQTRAWSPLKQALAGFHDGKHRFSSERNFARLSPGFEALRACLLSGGRNVEALLAPNFQGSNLHPARQPVLRQDELFEIRKAVWSAAADRVAAAGSLGAMEKSIRHQGPVLRRNEFLTQLRALLSSFSRIASVELECTAIQEDSQKAGLLRTKVIFQIAGEAAPVEAPSDLVAPASGHQAPPGKRHAANLNVGHPAGQHPFTEHHPPQLPNHEVSGEWLIDWNQPDQAGSVHSQVMTPSAQIAGWWFLHMSSVKTTRTLFTDVTASAFSQDPTFKSHLLRDTNYWRAVLDSASGIDIFGNCGVSVADVDGDGTEEIYLCQPQGLPNRLYRQKRPGVFEEFAAEAGIGLLDSCSMALFADILNRGRQDLIVISESAPLLFLNDGHGRFTLARRAFPPSSGETSLTGAALADYDRDGYLDLYVCAYGYFQGQGGNPLPSPYYDAQNGPPNYLYRNRGDGTFADVTEASQLNRGNNRFSFACAWVDLEGDGWPDLCVANDFGRNNLYRNRRDGTFEEIPDGIPGYGSGMSVSAADISGTGRQELYVGNMWAPAGMRVSQDPQFAGRFENASESSVAQFAMGNALYREAGKADGALPSSRPYPPGRRRTAALAPVPDAAGARRGRWAWCSDSFDLENDGHPDLYVANGFLTAPEPGRPPADAFLWEEVVASSPHSSIVSSPYRAAWTAIFQLAHEGHSWNGNERNVLFLNLGGGNFADISAVSGIDFPDDGRAFAVFDFDGDGDADMILHSRTGPQLRLLRNDSASRNQSISLRLTGTKSNRDAIGARVEVRTPSGCQARFVTCGSGFLAQHSKELIFGFGNQPLASEVSIRWPSGSETKFENLEAGYRYFIIEGHSKPRREKLATPAPAPPIEQKQLEADPVPQTFSAALIDPLPLPEIEALRGFTPPALHPRSAFAGRDERQRVLLWLWNPAKSRPEDLAPILKIQRQIPARLIILGEAPLPTAATSETPDLSHWVNPPWKADARFEQFVWLALSYLFDYRRKPPSPTGLLVEMGGPASGNDHGPAVKQREHPGPASKLVKVYWGGADPAEILQDAAKGVPNGQAALPFSGSSVLCSFARQTRTLGAALAQAGLYTEAEIYLAEAASGNRKDADTLYNLALVRRELGKADAARSDAQNALALRPDFPEAENLLGVLLIQSGNLVKAEGLFQRAAIQSPDFAEAWNNLGYVMLQKGDLPGAGKALSRAVQLAPQFPDALNNFGILEARQGNLEKAGELFGHALALQPANEQAANNLGVVYFHQGKADDARRTFLKLLEHNPEARSVLLNLAKLDITLGEKAEARRLLQSWIARHHGDAAAQALLLKAK